MLILESYLSGEMLDTWVAKGAEEEELTGFNMKPPNLFSKRPMREPLMLARCWHPVWTQ